MPAGVGGPVQRPYASRGGSRSGENAPVTGTRARQACRRHGPMTGLRPARVPRVTIGGCDLTLRIYVIAGEPSGDVLGARLVAALRQLGPVEAAGIGGERMAAEGVESLFPLEEIAVMGLIEVLPRAVRILRLMDRTAADILARRPHAVITIDSAGFNKGVAKRLIRAGFEVPRIHYVAPMVWAWWPGRAKKMARLFQHLLVLWPFEPHYFLSEGLSTTFVGHPLVEERRGDATAFRARHAVAVDATILAVLPGSRHGEVGRLLPVFRQTVAKLAETRCDLHLVVPTVATVGDRVAREVRRWPWPATVIWGEEDKRDAFAASRAALGASGTVSLELALAGVPQVTAYRVAPLSALIARRLARTDRFCLVNILLDRDVVPECMQGDCRPDRLEATLAPLLDDGPERREQIAAYAGLESCLHAQGMPPSRRAAEAVRQVVLDARQSRDRPIADTHGLKPE